MAARRLEKHGLDLADAGLIYDAPDKITLRSSRQDEERLMDGCGHGQGHGGGPGIGLR